MSAAETLLRIDACPEAIDYARDHTGTPCALWRACDRGDWLLWLADRVDVDRRFIVRAACACARTALVLSLIHI